MIQQTNSRSYRLVCSFPEHSEDIHGTYRGRQVARDRLDVVEQLPEVLHDGDPDHRDHSQHQDTQSVRAQRSGGSQLLGLKIRAHFFSKAPVTLPNPMF